MLVSGASIEPLENFEFPPALFLSLLILGCSHVVSTRAEEGVSWQLPERRPEQHRQDLSRDLMALEPWVKLN